MVRSFGEVVDDGSVEAAASVLRHIADRSDARCATYAELAGVVDRFWPAERHPAVDPIPLLDRTREVSGTSGTRIYSSGLLSRLAAAQPEPPARGSGDKSRGWIDGVEHCVPAELGDRVDSAAEELVPADPLRLRLRLRTLGVAAPEQRGTLPPLAELLFPDRSLHAASGETGAEGGEVVPWDVPTFLVWLGERGFEVVSERRVPRDPEELARSDPFADKLRWLDPLELQTEAVEVELRRSPAEAAEQAPASQLSFELVDDGSSRIPVPQS